MSYRANRYWWAYVVGGLAMFALALAMLAVQVGDILHSGVSGDWIQRDAFVALIAALLLTGIATSRASRKFTGPNRWWLRVRLFAIGLVLCVPFVALVSASLEAVALSHRAVAGSILQATFAIFITFFSFAYVAVGIFNRKQWQVRQQAIIGDIWVMPESRIVPETEDVFDVSREPLVLVWRSGPPFIPIVTFGVFCVNVTAVLLMTAAPLIQNVWTPPADSPMGVVLSEASRQSLMMAALLWTPVFVVIALILRNRLVIIEVISDGIRYQPLVGKVRLIRWHDMRLLEVDESKSRMGTMSTSFALYDNHGHVISWLEWGTALDLVQPEGITWDEIWALSRELVDVIYQRTGLMPRTFSESLQRGPADDLSREVDVPTGVDDDA